jgi:hypothetical protein
MRLSVAFVRVRARLMSAYMHGAQRVMKVGFELVVFAAFERSAFLFEK